MSNNLLIQHDVLEEFSALLEEKMGLHYAEKRWGELERKLHLITQSFHFEDPVECVHWLKKSALDKRQFAVLSFHLTVGETYFFRDEGFFKSLETTILPEIFKRHQDDLTLRIWCAGCCTGEEIYSIAILLHRMLPNLHEWNLRLLGTDINPEFLVKAEKGTYKKWSFRTTPPEILERYFHKDNERYTLIPEIRHLVKFMTLNLIDDSYPDVNHNTHEMDLISCHNVFIYFSEKQIKKAVHQMTKSLTDQGLFSVAPVETSLILDKELKAFKVPGSIYYRKGKYPERPVISLPSPLPKVKKTLLKIPHKRKAPEVKQVAKEKRYQHVISTLSNAEKGLKEIQLLISACANTGALKEGLEWCEKAIQIDKLDPLTHYLHASLLEACDKSPAAIKALKTALFLNPHFILAHYLLGMIEENQGNPKDAIRHIKIAAELMEKHPKDKDLPGNLDFSEEHLKTLITDHLRRL